MDFVYVEDGTSIYGKKKKERVNGCHRTSEVSSVLYAIPTD